MTKETGRSRQLSGGNGCREQLEALSPPERGSRDRKGLVCVCVFFFTTPLPKFFVRVGRRATRRTFVQRPQVIRILTSGVKQEGFAMLVRRPRENSIAQVVVSAKEEKHRSKNH